LYKKPRIKADSDLSSASLESPSPVHSYRPPGFFENFFHGFSSELRIFLPPGDESLLNKLATRLIIEAAKLIISVAKLIFLYPFSCFLPVYTITDLDYKVR
jgi:hypothetical protein